MQLYKEEGYPEISHPTSSIQAPEISLLGEQKNGAVIQRAGKGFKFATRCSLKVRPCVCFVSCASALVSKISTRIKDRTPSSRQSTSGLCSTGTYPLTLVLRSANNVCLFYRPYNSWPVLLGTGGYWRDLKAHSTFVLFCIKIY
jgi:hypothetical protein